MGLHTWQFIPPFIAAGITTLVGLYAWRRRNVPGAAPLAGWLLVVTLWQVAIGLSTAARTPAAAYFWHRVSFSAIVFIAPTALAFILHISGRAAWLSPARLAGLFGFPLLTLLVIWTNALHHGFIRDYAFTWVDGALRLTAWQAGFWYYLHTGYSFLLTLLAVGLVGWSAARAPQPFRGQMTVILAWCGLALLIAIPLTLRLYQPRFILAALLPILNSLGFAWAVFRFQLLDLSPVARDLLIETMSDGMVTLDPRGRIVDVNPALEALTGLTRATLIGQTLLSLPPPWNALDRQTEIVLGPDRLLHVQITPLAGRRKQPRGCLILVRDVTTLKLMETLEARVAARTQDLSTLYQIASLLGHSLNLADVLPGCLTHIVAATAGSGGVIVLQDEPAAWRVAAAYGAAPPALGEEAAWWESLAAAGEALLVHEVARSPWAARRLPSPWPFPALAAAPILTTTGRGLIVLFGQRPAQFNIESLGLLTTVSEQIGVALENDRLRRQQQETAVLIERQRLARDLHDSVTQLLYSQILFARAAQKAQRAGHESQASGFLTRLDAAAQQALREMRLLIYQLRPSDLADIGLVEALRRRLELVEQRAGVVADLQVDAWVTQHGMTLPAHLQQEVYHVAEEALNNVLKHAAAGQVMVALQYIEPDFILDIRDDGRGFDPTSVRAGLGLPGMRERAALLGGALTLTAAPGGGAHLRLALPLKSPALSAD
ncbi:MAG TPA: histidine kinase N-terminal 7TM domain-containing protein [Anaerolineae bacterium]|nr:histidine kinase N-terminal 7TM domain-containing protein [Anaerolineae bacterium]